MRVHKTAKNIIGKKGEDIVKEFLKKQGYFILPSSLIQDDGAPVLEGEKLKIILPNNLTWKDKQPGWVEVKTKSYATFHLNPPRRWEHGLPLRHWVAYQEVQKFTNTQVSLAVLELDTKLLLIAPLDHLAQNKRISQIQGEPHIFLARDDFDNWFSINTEIPNPIRPIAPRTLTQIKAPMYKQGQL
jgi:hypothetical protein